MALDVKVKIDLSAPAGNLGFGYPLILNIGEAKDYAEYTNLDELVTAGFAATTDVYKAAALMFAQNNPPEKIAVCGVAETSDLSSIKDKGWRQLVALNAETSDATAIATYVDTTSDKMFFYGVTDTTALEAVKTNKRVVAFYHNDKLAVAALAGEAAGRVPGSFTYKNLILNGIEPMDLSNTSLGDDTHTVISFVTKAGDNVTTHGQAVDGEFIDVIDSKDCIIAQIEYRVQKLLNAAGKLPYTNAGIAAIESEVIGVLNDAYNNGIISETDGKPDYSVNFKTRDEMTAADRKDRIYTGGNFTFTLAGAIHKVEINGELVI